jgi:hypothetical protein
MFILPQITRFGMDFNRSKSPKVLIKKAKKAKKYKKRQKRQKVNKINKKSQ